MKAGNMVARPDVPALVMGAVLALSGLTACSAGNQVQGPDQSATIAEELVQESLLSDSSPTTEVSTGGDDTPESTATEKETTPEYQMPPEHVHYDTILNEWWSLSSEEAEKLAKGPDFTKRAEFIAAMYMWLSDDNEYSIMVENAGTGVDAMGYNDCNPVFMERDIEDLSPYGRNCLAGVQDLFPIMAALKAKELGMSPEEVHEVFSNTWSALIGPSQLVGGTKAGLSKASWDSLSLQEGQKPDRRDTETRYLTTDELLARTEESERLKNSSYELIGMRIANKDNPEISTDRIFAMVPLDRRPDYDGNTPGFEFKDPGTPNTLGHPTKETIFIPVVVAEFEN